MYEEIEKVLDEEVRPYLRSHGGDMIIDSFTEKDGILRFKLTGACSGCPASDLTTEELINATLTEKLRYVKKTVLIQTVSDDILNQAREILRQRHQNEH